MKGFVLPAEDWGAADLKQVKTKLPWRTSPQCPRLFSVLQLTDGFIHKSEFLMSLLTSRNKPKFFNCGVLSSRSLPLSSWIELLWPQATLFIKKIMGKSIKQTLINGHHTFNYLFQYLQTNSHQWEELPHVLKARFPGMSSTWRSSRAIFSIDSRSKIDFHDICHEKKPRSSQKQYGCEKDTGKHNFFSIATF